MFRRSRSRSGVGVLGLGIVGLLALGGGVPTAAAQPAPQAITSSKAVRVDFEDQKEIPEKGPKLDTFTAKGFVFTPAGGKLSMNGPGEGWPTLPSLALYGGSWGTSIRIAQANGQPFDLSSMDIVAPQALSAVVEGKLASGAPVRQVVALPPIPGIRVAWLKADWTGVQNLEISFYANPDGTGRKVTGGIDNLWLNIVRVARVQPPELSVKPGLYPSEQRLSITCPTKDAVIHYGTWKPGKKPEFSVYNGTPIPIPAPGAAFYVWATHRGMASSPMLTPRYYIGKGGAPEISQQPQNVTIGPKKGGMFLCTTRGEIPAMYRWQIKRPGQPNFVDVPDGVESTFGTHGMGESDNGAQLRCIVSNDFGATTSQAATLIYMK